MGDSITEGTVAEIHKQQSDPVEEDEPILTLETDKVAIEVRSPQQGTLQAILVQADDNVHIGQVVAVVDDCSTAAGRSGSQNATQQIYDALADAASELSDKSLKGHKARIRFPPRRTSDGHVISAMPAVDQQKYINRTSISQEKPRPETVLNFGEHDGHAQQCTVAPFVPRRTLSEREMDSIMLGGAE